MYAVIETGGKQYRVNEGEVVRVELLTDEIGSQVAFETVNLVATDDKVHVGTPTVAGAVVRATVLEQGRGPKVLSFKKKRRKGYRRKIGHRQAFTAVKIDEIVVPTAPRKSKAKAEEVTEDTTGEVPTPKPKRKAKAKTTAETPKPKRKAKAKATAETPKPKRKTKAKATAETPEPKRKTKAKATAETPKPKRKARAKTTAETPKPERKTKARTTRASAGGAAEAPKPRRKTKAHKTKAAPEGESKD